MNTGRIKNFEEGHYGAIYVASVVTCSFCTYNMHGGAVSPIATVPLKCGT